MSYKPVVLVIMDGVGLSIDPKGNAVAQARTPNLDRISGQYPGTALHASGIEVGLPWGEVGSSQVGHTNIGAGFVLYQNLPRITLAIESGAFFKMPIWKEITEHAKQNDTAIHLMGMASSGGVHSHISHLYAIIDAIKKLSFRGEVFVHFFTDGQDVPPRTAGKFVKDLEAYLKKMKIGRIATVIGKKYALDRDDNWPLTEQAFQCMTTGSGATAPSAEAAITQAHQVGVEDEVIEPTVIEKEGLIKERDAVVFFNFRPDRARQLTQMFTQKLPELFFATMTEYREGLPVRVAFPSQTIDEPLGKVIADAGKTQLRIAESEKAAHVTYFVNGGRETQFPGENRYLLPSPKVESYTQAPEMAARALTEGTLNAIAQGYDFILVNFANGDMVGHTGDLRAAARAVEMLDECIGRITEAALNDGGAVVITGDHGNCEEMINLETDEVDKEHSTNPVPLWILTPDNGLPKPSQPPATIHVTGALIDVAPTVLELMGLRAPGAMEGKSLANIRTLQGLGPR